VVVPSFNSMGTGGAPDDCPRGSYTGISPQVDSASSVTVPPGEPARVILGDEAIALHPLFAFDRICRHMIRPVKTIAMPCITTYPAGVARNSFINLTVHLTASRYSSSSSIGWSGFPAKEREHGADDG
jgi:hypothetical protein